MNPTGESDTIVKEITIRAPAERIFEALTDPQQPAGDIEAHSVAAIGRLGRDQARRHGANLSTQCRAAARHQQLAEGL